VERIKVTIDSLFKDLVAKKNLGADSGPERWLKNVLTKKELRHIKLHYFRKGILGLSVDSSVWMYALNLKKESLLKKLKEESQDVKEIRFSIGEVK
jgi:hypothetical protein